MNASYRLTLLTTLMILGIAGCSDGSTSFLSGVGDFFASLSGSGGGESQSLATLGVEAQDRLTSSEGVVARLSNPEPASLALFGSGLAGLAYWRRRQTRKRAPGQR